LEALLVLAFGSAVYRHQEAYSVRTLRDLLREQLGLRLSDLF
jgi:hypothetical protein